jgi:uncharacterized membrane protein YeaQ/YmgE (transglycosylase-associated protein family)
MDTINWIIASPVICLGWLIVGFIAGALARRIMGSPNRNFISDIILGIIGAVIGGWVAGLFGMRPADGVFGLELVLVHLVIATIGAVILIAIKNAIFGRRK